MQYVIPFTTLSVGKHEFDFEIDNVFFENFGEDAIVKAGELNTKVVLEHKTTFMILEYEINGIAKVECDRCLELLNVKIGDNGKIYVKFGYSEQQDPDVIFISPEDTDIDLKQIIYELIALNIPIRNVHADSENGESTCNAKMIELLNKHAVSDIGDTKEETDPRWNELNSLLN